MTYPEVTITSGLETVEIDNGAIPLIETTEELATVEVTVDDATTELITAADTVEVTIIDDGPVTIEVAEPELVVVYTDGPRGTGIGGFYNQAEILTLLENAITLDQLIPGIRSDLVELNTLLTRAGGYQTGILTTQDGTDILSGANVYTDSEVATLQLNIDLVEGNLTQLQIDFDAHVAVPPLPTQGELLTILTGSLTLDQMVPGLYNDLTMLTDFWIRVGNQLEVLFSDDTVDITTAYQLYTNTQIASVVLAVEAVDGRVDLNYSAISQTNARIDLNVTHLTTHDDDISVQEGRITIAEDAIALSVIDINTLGGRVTATEGTLVVNANAITAAVSRITAAEGDIIDNIAGIQINADDILAYVTQLNTNTGLLESAQIELTATSAATSVLQTSLDGTQADLSAVELMMASQWGVTITEDPNGIPYTTGINLMLHPNWATGTTYTVAPVTSWVYFYNAGVGKIYRCIQAHTASTANNPASLDDGLGGDGTDYWVEDATRKKTSFRVKADEFSVYASETNPTEALFRVVGDRIIIGSGVALESENYATTTVPGYSLDAAAGTAEFRNITMTFTGTGQADAQTALNVSDGATVGATWGSNITDQPSDAALLNVNQVWSDITGAGLPADNADVTGDNTAADTTNVSGTAAGTVRDNAANAMTAVTAMESDDIFSIPEKELWQIHWPGMLANHTNILAQATTYGIEAETVFTDFTTAKNTLFTFLDTTHNVFAASPAASAITAGDITAPTTAFYDTMALAVNRLAEYTLWSDVTGTGIPADNADVTGDNTAADTAAVGGTAAATVRDNAVNAAAAVTAMEADSVFSIPEKEMWQIQWPGMLANYTNILAQATTYGIEAEAVFTNFTTSKNTLYTFLDTTHSAFAASPAASAITAGDIATPTADFYDKMALSVNRLGEYIAAGSVGLTQLGTTVISGGYIATDLVNAASIVANSITASEIAAGTITSTEIAANTITGAEISATIGIELSAGGYLKSTGKDSYNDATAGFFLGYDGVSEYTFGIGDATNYMTWDGSTLAVGGSIIGTGNIVANAVSDSDGAYSASGNCAGTLLSVTVETTAAAEDIYVIAVLAIDLDADPYRYGGTAIIQENTTTRVSSAISSTQWTDNDVCSMAYVKTDSAASTSYTFNLSSSIVGATYTYASLVALLLKK